MDSIWPTPRNGIPVVGKTKLQSLVLLLEPLREAQGLKIGLLQLNGLTNLKDREKNLIDRTAKYVVSFM